MIRKSCRARYIYDALARALTLGLALVMAVPAIASRFTSDDERAKWENRNLATLPSLGWNLDGEPFFDALDKYLNDHFGLALTLNRFHRRLVYYVFRDSPVPNLTVGKDGFLFLNAHGTNKPFAALKKLCIEDVNPAAIETAASSWDRILKFYEQRIPRVALLIPPSKPVLYPEKLPDSVPRAIREACGQYHAATTGPGSLAAKVGGQISTVIYPLDPFFRLRFDQNFYPKENFHFAGTSAHTLARKALVALAIHPDARYDESIPGQADTSDLSRLLGFERPIRVTSYPYTGFGLARKPQEPRTVRSYYAKASDFGTIVAQSPLSGRSALVISNSFGAFTVGHLAPGYRSITWVNINDLNESESEGFFGAFIRAQRPDDLILVIHDGSISWQGTLWSRALPALERVWPPNQTHAVMHDHVAPLASGQGS